MFLCKNEVQIPIIRRISHRFDTPLVILQVEVDRDDHNPKFIKMRVLDKKKPWNLFYLNYNSEF